MKFAGHFSEFGLTTCFSRIFELGPQFQNMLIIVYLMLATVTESVQWSALFEFKDLT